MCDARAWFEKEAQERGMTEAELEREWAYYCDLWGAVFEHGFIFRDGSVLEISKYEDHRTIPIEDWDEYNIITYDISGDEADFRVNWGITYAQVESIMDIMTTMGADKLYIDVYSYGDKHREVIEHDRYEVNAYTLYEEIKNALYAG